VITPRPTTMSKSGKNSKSVKKYKTVWEMSAKLKHQCPSPPSADALSFRSQNELVARSSNVFAQEVEWRTVCLCNGIFVSRMRVSVASFSKSTKRRCFYSFRLLHELVARSSNVFAREVEWRTVCLCNGIFVSRIK
jgi:hypothetical protein